MHALGTCTIAREPWLDFPWYDLVCITSISLRVCVFVFIRENAEEIARGHRCCTLYLSPGTAFQNTVHTRGNNRAREAPRMQGRTGNRRKRGYACVSSFTHVQSLAENHRHRLRHLFQVSPSLRFPRTVLR